MQEFFILAKIILAVSHFCRAFNSLSRFLSRFLSPGYNWVLIQALVFCYTICTFAAAADSKSAPYGFLAIWSMMITLALSAGGTMVLRRVDYRTCVNSHL